MTSIEQQGTYVNSNILCSQLNCIVSFLVVPRQTTVHMICTTFQILYTYFCIRSGLHISEKSSIIKLDNKNCVILRCIWSKHKRHASWISHGSGWPAGLSTGAPEVAGCGDLS